MKHLSPTQLARWLFFPPASMAIRSSGTRRLAGYSTAALLHYRCCHMRVSLLQVSWLSLHRLGDDPESPTCQVQFSHKTCHSPLDVHVPCAYNSSNTNGTHTSADLVNSYNDIAAIALSCSDCDWLYCSASICKKLSWVIREKMAKYPSNTATAGAFSCASSSTTAVSCRQAQGARQVHSPLACT